jgi:2-keto-4-pentenoate hydratase
MDANVRGLASELLTAWTNGAPIAQPLSSRHGPFDLAAAYAVEAELVRLRQAAGRTVVGLKVGYANKAVWRALKLETLVWAHIYDDTVQYANDNRAALSVARMAAPKIEPEIVFKLKQPFIGGADPAAILAHVEWLALGFEIIDCPFPGWQFQPVDFVAVFGLHKALIVGQSHPIQPETIPALAEQLPQFKLRLFRNGALVEEGSGKNSLRSPALCLGELARVTTISAGELVSSGTLTSGALIAAGDEFRAEVEGVDLPSLTLEVSY